MTQHPHRIRPHAPRHWKMFQAHVALLAAIVAAVGCSGRGDTGADAVALPPARAAAIEQEVRAFAATVAADITREGPKAWRAHFSDTPSFFMAAEGQLVFPDSAAATRAIQDLSRTITHIELRWGDGLRVDPLAPGLAVVAAPYDEVRVDAAGHRVVEKGYFTGLAERRAGRWQFRNAHWSVVSPTAATP